MDIPLDSKVLKDVVENAKDFCLMHGEFIVLANVKIFKCQAQFHKI